MSSEVLSNVYSLPTWVLHVANAANRKKNAFDLSKTFTRCTIIKFHETT